jgi:hypothetical protein
VFAYQISISGMLDSFQIEKNIGHKHKRSMMGYTCHASGNAPVGLELPPSEPSSSVDLQDAELYVLTSCLRVGT